MMNVYNPDKFKSLPDGILFDTDNTLYPYQPAHIKAKNTVKAKMATMLFVDSKQIDEVYAKAREEINHRLSGTASSHNRLLYFQRMLEIMGLGSQVLLALDFEQTYWRAFLTNATLFNDVDGLLNDLKVLEIPLAIVTDLTAQIQFRKMVYWGLDKHFDYIVTSEEAGFDKPNPVPFEIAKRKINPKGDNIWMIGDNYIADICGARDSINATTLQKTHDSDACDETNGIKPDLIFNSFKDIRNLLRGISNE